MPGITLFIPFFSFSSTIHVLNISNPSSMLLNSNGFLENSYPRQLKARSASHSLQQCTQLKFFCDSCNLGILCVRLQIRYLSVFKWICQLAKASKPYITSRCLLFHLLSFEPLYLDFTGSSFICFILVQFNE